MKFPSPLQRGTLIRRYKRFLADVQLDSGATVTAHCANPGSMMGLTEPGMRVWLSHTDDPARKLAYSWQLLEIDNGAVKEPTFVGINTGNPNRLVAEAIRTGRITELCGYSRLRTEVRYGINSRIDILLSDGPDGKDCYVEVKNVHLLRRPGLAEFPDSVTKRGAKHLDELAGMTRAGHRAVMVYLVQRTDAERMALAEDIDPAYAQAFASACTAGVEAICYSCKLSPEEIVVDRALPFARGTASNLTSPSG